MSTDQGSSKNTNQKTKEMLDVFNNITAQKEIENLLLLTLPMKKDLFLL
jgi:hypothetical protein